MICAEYVPDRWGVARKDCYFSRALAAHPGAVRGVERTGDLDGVIQNLI